MFIIKIELHIVDEDGVRILVGPRLRHFSFVDLQKKMETTTLILFVMVVLALVFALFASGVIIYTFIKGNGPLRPLAMKTVLATDKQNVTYGAKNTELFVGAQRIKNGVTVNGHYYATGTTFAVVNQLQESKIFQVTATGVIPVSHQAETPLTASHPIIQMSVVNEDTVRSAFNQYNSAIIFPGAYGRDILGTLSGVSNNVLDKIGLLDLPEIDASQFNTSVPGLVQDSSFSEMLLGTLQYFKTAPAYTIHDFIYATNRSALFYNKATTPTVTVTFPIGVVFQSYYAWSIDNTDIMTITTTEGAANGDSYVLRGISKITNLIEKNDTNYIVLSTGQTLLAEVIVGFDGSSITLDSSNRPVVTVTVNAPDPVVDIGPQAADFACYYCVRVRGILVSGYPNL